MYRLYTESVNNPENKVLAEQVQTLKSELEALQEEMMEIDKIYTKEFFGTNVQVMSNEYIPTQVKVHPETGATIAIPASTANTAAIIADDIESE